MPGCARPRSPRGTRGGSGGTTRCRPPARTSARRSARRSRTWQFASWENRGQMSIVENRKAFHDYFIEERYEAGIVLEGWEVKAIRGGRGNIGEGYVMVRGEELFLIGAHISPLPTASTHVTPDPTRTRKLLLRAEEIRRLIGKVEQRGYALGPLNLHYTKGRIKLEVGLGRGKLKHDKRADQREKEWNREKQRLLRSK